MSSEETEEQSLGLAFRQNDKWVHRTAKWMEVVGVRYDVGSGSFCIGARNLTTKDVAMMAKTDIRYGKGHMNMDQATVVVKQIAHERRTAAIQTVCESLLVPPRCDDSELRKWLFEMMVSTDVEDQENALAVMKHWLWLVERQLLGLELSWHMMPIFWSGQGGGKSFQIRDLLKPLGFLWRKATFQVVVGQFDSMPMHYNYALFFDEMASVAHADAAKLKYAIDAEVVPGRNMHDDSGRKITKNSLFICATNDPPPHGLGDTTGNRRMFSIETKTTRVNGTERQHIFDSVDYLKIWQCVDPNGPSPILGRFEIIRGKQEEVKLQSVLEQYITDHLVPSEDYIMLSDIQVELSTYAAQRGWRHFKSPGQLELRFQLQANGLTCVNHGNRWKLKGYSVC